MTKAMNPIHAGVIVFDGLLLAKQYFQVAPLVVVYHYAMNRDVASIGRRFLL